MLPWMRGGGAVDRMRCGRRDGQNGGLIFVAVCMWARARGGGGGFGDRELNAESAELTADLSERVCNENHGETVPRVMG